MNTNSSTYNATNCYTLKVQLGTATEPELAGSNELPEEIEEEKSDDFNVMVFPNPVTDKLTIYMVGDNTTKNLSVYDITGRNVYTQSITEMFTTLDLQSIARGNYIVTVSQQNGKLLHSEKVVLK